MSRDPTWLDGPRFLSWLEADYNFDSHAHGKTIERRANRWKHGECVSVWSADRFLIKIGLHLTLVPEDIWLPRKPGPLTYTRGNRPTPEQKKEIIKRCGEGAPVAALAQEVGVTERTIRKWCQVDRERYAQTKET